MKNIQWTVRTFRELTLDQWYELLKLRVDVFVVEQRCAYPELDEYDRHEETRHLMGRDESSHLIAYARLLPPGTRYSEANLGRVVVKAECRKQGIGHQLIRMADQEISRCWPQSPVRISAQDYLQAFYEHYDFIQVSDVYLEDGIPHIEMVKESKK